MHSPSTLSPAWAAEFARHLRIGLALALPLLFVLILSACGDTGAATPAAVRVHVTATPARFVPDPPEKTQTTAKGQLPTTLLASAGSDARIQALYQGALDHPDVYSKIPCYCGCAIYQHPHTSLLSCFIQTTAADGSITWTDHSTSCDICTGVAQMTMDNIAKGTPLAQIRDLVHAKFKYTGVW